MPKWVNKVYRVQKKKSFFQKGSWTTWNAKTNVFWPWWPVWAFLKSQNAFKMGHFATKIGSKMGENCVLPKMILDHLGCLNKGNEPMLSSLHAILAPPKSPNDLKMGCFWSKKWLKDGSKMCFAKDTFGLLGVHKLVE